MRIISGKKRGLRLSTVGKGDTAAHLRPTSDRVRESIFNLLMGGAYGDPLTDARVLDLFAGTGALGLEAWSRGALHVTFVDDGKKSHSLMRQNVELCDASAETKIFRGNATNMQSCKTKPFDLIFLDPPYGKGLGEKSLASAHAKGWLANDALIVFEEGTELPYLPGFDLLDHRRYGDTHVTILEQASLT